MRRQSTGAKKRRQISLDRRQLMAIDTTSLTSTISSDTTGSFYSVTSSVQDLRSVLLLSGLSASGNLVKLKQAG